MRSKTLRVIAGHCLRHLHIAVVRSTSAFWHHPVDILRWVLNVTGFAVNAILSIDLKALLTIRFVDDLIDASRAIALGGFII